MEKKLPKGWVETPIENLFNLVYGKSISTKDLLNSDYNGDLYDVYGANGIIGKFSNYSYKNSKVIISCRGAASGKIHKTNPYSFISSNSIILDEINEALLNLDFVKYVMTIAEKSAIITGTAQPQITIQLLKDLKIPLPPLAEQERIVAKLDKLFAQHEQIKKALDRIPQLLKAFRQQVLTKAIESKKGTRKLKDFLTDIKYGTSKKSEYGINGTPILRIPNIENGRINDKDLKYSLLDEKEYETLKLRKNDILIIRSNGSVSLVGQSAIVTSEHENYSYAGYLIRIRLNANYEAEYLNYIFKSNFIRSQMIDTSRSTSGVNNINSKEIQELNIPDIEIDEQQNIVKRVESLFAKADTIEARYLTLRAKIDSLPQSILHKAFKGELVPQLPTDGDAKDLLAEIMALKEEVKGRK